MRTKPIVFWVATAAAWLLFHTTTSYPVSVYAGKLNQAGDGANGATPTNIALNTPGGVHYDTTNGVLYIADTKNSRIRQITVSAYSQKYFAGNGQSGYASNKATGSPTQVVLNNPMGVSGDSAGNVYISDTFNHCIRRVYAAGSSLTLLAGACSQHGYVDSSIPTSAKFYRPRGLWVDSGGAVYVADLMNYRIRRIASSGTTTTVAGTGSSAYSSSSGAATSIPLYFPLGVWSSSTGDVFAADFNSIRRITISTSQMTLYAGNNQAGQSTINGAVAMQTNLNEIVSIYGDSYASSSSNRQIFFVYSSTDTVQAVTGNGTAGNNADSLKASVMSALGVTSDGQGAFFFADASAQVVKKADIGTFVSPTYRPTPTPTVSPSLAPTSQPTGQPTSQPTGQPNVCTAPRLPAPPSHHHLRRRHRRGVRPPARRSPPWNRRCGRRLPRLCRPHRSPPLVRRPPTRLVIDPAPLRVLRQPSTLLCRPLLRRVRHRALSSPPFRAKCPVPYPVPHQACLRVPCPAGLPGPRSVQRPSVCTVDSPAQPQLLSTPLPRLQCNPARRLPLQLPVQLPVQLPAYGPAHGRVQS